MSVFKTAKWPGAPGKKGPKLNKVGFREVVAYAAQDLGDDDGLLGNITPTTQNIPTPPTIALPRPGINNFPAFTGPMPFGVGEHGQNRPIGGTPPSPWYSQFSWGRRR
jgi:hypothetical protein